MLEAITSQVSKSNLKWHFRAFHSVSAHSRRFPSSANPGILLPGFHATTDILVAAIARNQEVSTGVGPQLITNAATSNGYFISSLVPLRNS